MTLEQKINEILNSFEELELKIVELNNNVSKAKELLKNVKTEEELHNFVDNLVLYI